MIREFQPSDTEQVMQLWLSGNEEAHWFIPQSYWRSHSCEVREALWKAKVFVAVADGSVHGFLGMVQDFIAGIFVDKNYRSLGIGTQLLTYAKQTYDTLFLSVYQKNTRAVAFYRREGFFVLSEGIDNDTGEKEYTMGWKKGSPLSDSESKVRV